MGEVEHTYRYRSKCRVEGCNEPREEGSSLAMCIKHRKAHKNQQRAERKANKGAKQPNRLLPTDD